MKTSRLVLASAVASIALSFATIVHADPINIASTGSTGAFGKADPNWTVSYSTTPGGGFVYGGTATNAPAIIVHPYGFPNGNVWATPPSGSNWITAFGGPAGNAFDSVQNGSFNFTTTFNISLDPATAVIFGKVSSDDEVTSVVLNGHTINFTTPNQGYGSLYNFTTTKADSSFFVSGTNTITFNTANTHGVAEGFIASLQGTQSVPEPASLALLGIGSLGAVRLVRRSRKSVIA